MKWNARSLNNYKNSDKSNDSATSQHNKIQQNPYTHHEWPENVHRTFFSSLTHFHKYFRHFFFIFQIVKWWNKHLYFNFMKTKLVVKSFFCLSFFWGGGESETTNPIDKLASNWWSFIILEFHNVIKLYCINRVSCFNGTESSG